MADAAEIGTSGTDDDVAAAQRLVEAYGRIRQELGKVIVGQDRVIEELLIALFGGGHCILEGVPGLAKTLSVRTLAAAIEADFQRIQFTPDLLPADIIGTLIYNPRDGEFTTKI